MQIEEFVIPGAGQQFKGNDFRDLRKSGVYLFMLEGKPLYIGTGRMLLGRASGKHKQAEEAIAQCDTVLLYPCLSWFIAQQLETLLINKLQPKYNKRKKLGILSGILGHSKGHARKYQRELAMALEGK